MECDRNRVISVIIINVKLFLKGYDGAKQILEILRKEFDMSMALSGCRKLSDIEPSMVVSERYFRSYL